MSNLRWVVFCCRVDNAHSGIRFLRLVVALQLVRVEAFCVEAGLLFRLLALCPGAPEPDSVGLGGPLLAGAGLRLSGLAQIDDLGHGRSKPAGSGSPPRR